MKSENKIGAIDILNDIRQTRKILMKAASELVGLSNCDDIYDINTTTSYDKIFGGSSINCDISAWLSHNDKKLEIIENVNKLKAYYYNVHGSYEYVGLTDLVYRYLITLLVKSNCEEEEL